MYETEYGFVIILIEDSVADDSFLTKRSIYECVIISSAIVMRIQCMLRPQLACYVSSNQNIGKVLSISHYSNTIGH